MRFGPIDSDRLDDTPTARLHADLLDPQHGLCSETDRFDRLLRYAYMPDGNMINAMMVQEGYATAATFPPDVKYQERFAELNVPLGRRDESGDNISAARRNTFVSVSREMVAPCRVSSFSIT